jgi:hypothetical protein
MSSFFFHENIILTGRAEKRERAICKFATELSPVKSGEEI